MFYCQVNFTFINNTLTNEDGQGQDFYAEDISYCIIGRGESNAKKVFDSSIFSNTHILNFRQVYMIVSIVTSWCFFCSQKEGSSNRNFETSPNALNLVGMLLLELGLTS